MPRQPPRKTKKVTDAQLVQAIIDARGILAAAARDLGLARAYIYERIRESPAAQAAVTDAREGAVDVAEAALYRAASKGEAWAVKYLLSTQGKARGYVERRELTGGGEPLQVEVVRRIVHVARGDGADD